MNIEIYSIIAMIGRYVLVILCFLVFLQAILEIKKASHYDSSMDLASLKWLRKRTLFSLGQENTIGRASSCDIVIKAATIKSRHFQIYLDCGEWIVQPIKKSQVSINKFPIDGKVQLSDGDKITTGRENFIFTITPDFEEESDD